MYRHSQQTLYIDASSGHMHTQLLVATILANTCLENCYCYCCSCVALPSTGQECLQLGLHAQVCHDSRHTCSQLEIWECHQSNGYTIGYSCLMFLTQYPCRTALFLTRQNSIFCAYNCAGFVLSWAKFFLMHSSYAHRPKSRNDDVGNEKAMAFSTFITKTCPDSWLAYLKLHDVLSFV